MSKKQYMSSKLNSQATYLMYKEQNIAIAKSVFIIEGLPDIIDENYLNDRLLFNGAIAFFIDEVLGLLALPYRVIGNLNLYGEPNKIQCYGKNGYQSKILKSGDFVIMYDNLSKRSIMPSIDQYSRRIAEIQRTIDINVKQQKTPRIIKGSSDTQVSLKDLFNKIDSNEDIIYTYKSIDLEDIESVLMPAPYVADRLEELKQGQLNELMALLGVSSLSINKKERLITDEVKSSIAGAIANRYNRFLPRRKAIELINKNFGVDLAVHYYDDEPTTNIELPFEEVDDVSVF